MSMAISMRRQSPPSVAPTAMAIISLSSLLLPPVLGVFEVVGPEVVSSSTGFTMALPVVLGSSVVGEAVVGGGGAVIETLPVFYYRFLAYNSMAKNRLNY